MSEYHRHDSGDVVQGPAERCIDPNAGARDVLVVEPAHLRAMQAAAWERGHFYCAAEQGTDTRCVNPYEATS